jgi:hypothetical protein
VTAEAFRIDVPDERIDDFHRRRDARASDAGWEYGLPTDLLEDWVGRCAASTGGAPSAR